ncbi:Hypothetical predicted protein [Octopus vulgaris]|uniref:Uncharacterized protein n=1 Tax=Octopus vulgaris TaxID=6645 RepID=A0AA36BGZ3_OCTVU|nr:Hypothetical predicted protein [Octopus vulgaris]
MSWFLIVCGVSAAIAIYTVLAANREQPRRYDPQELYAVREPYEQRTCVTFNEKNVSREAYINISTACRTERNGVIQRRRNVNGASGSSVSIRE